MLSPQNLIKAGELYLYPAYAENGKQIAWHVYDKYLREFPELMPLEVFPIAQQKSTIVFTQPIYQDQYKRPAYSTRVFTRNLPTQTGNNNWFGSLKKLTPVRIVQIVFASFVILLILGGMFTYAGEHPTKQATPMVHSRIVTQTASQKIRRLDSSHMDQFSVLSDPGAASAASCYGCSVAEVMNAYGKHLTCGQILKIVQDRGHWSTAQGLDGSAGWRDTANWVGQLRFSAEASYNNTILERLVSVANSGRPVIVGLGAHILVIKSGKIITVNVVVVKNGKKTIIKSPFVTQVNVVDSNAPQYFRTLTRSELLNGVADPNNGDWYAWDGSYIILKPL